MKLRHAMLAALLLVHALPARAGEPLPETCSLEPFETVLAGEQHARLKAAWSSAVETAAKTRDRLLDEESRALGSTERRQKKRETRLALMQSRIVANQQQIFLALGAERQALAATLSDRLEACVAAIREALE